MSECLEVGAEVNSTSPVQVVRLLASILVVVASGGLFDLTDLMSMSGWWTSAKSRPVSLEANWVGTADPVAGSSQLELFRYGW